MSANKAIMTLTLGGKEYKLGCNLDDEDGTPLTEDATKRILEALTHAARSTVAIYHQWGPYKGMTMPSEVMK